MRVEGPALFEEIQDEQRGDVQRGRFVDALGPGVVETPDRETAEAIAPSPHHPLGAKRVGEPVAVGAVAAIVNAVVDTLAHLCIRHIDIPITSDAVWILEDQGVADGRHALSSP